jgi:hypothetical protein
MNCRTLCWTCENACGGCSWSDGSFTPVEGWKAKQTKMVCEYGKGHVKDMTSYIVTYCPLYKDDSKKYRIPRGEKRWN